jgi:hypothetical protein
LEQTGTSEAFPAQKLFAMLEREHAECKSYITNIAN